MTKRKLAILLLLLPLLLSGCSTPEKKAVREIYGPIVLLDDNQGALNPFPELKPGDQVILNGQSGTKGIIRIVSEESSTTKLPKIPKDEVRSANHGVALLGDDTVVFYPFSYLKAGDKVVVNSPTNGGVKTITLVLKSSKSKDETPTNTLYEPDDPHPPSPTD